MLLGGRGKGPEKGEEPSGREQTTHVEGEQEVGVLQSTGHGVRSPGL